MALDYTDTYPGQVIGGDPEYPYGKARNITVVGDGTGTPWEKDLVNDWLGFLQQILVSAEITPSGTPDRVGSSQYLVGLLALAKKTIEEAAPLTLQNDAEVQGEFRSTGGSRFTGVQLFEGSCVFSGPVNSFSSPTTFTAAATMTGGATITNLVVHGTVLSDAAIGQSAEITLTGAGRIRQRTQYAPDADTDYSVASVDNLVVRSTTLTAPRAYKLESANAAVGSTFEVRTYDPANQVTIVNDSDVELVKVPLAITNPYVAFSAVPGVVRFKYEDDGLSARWQATEILDPADTFTTIP